MKHGGAMTYENKYIGSIEAQAMLEAFASVGVTRFDITLTTTAGDKDAFQRGVTLSELQETLPGRLDAAVSVQRNLIVRPYGSRGTFIQLDDLKTEQLSKVASIAFLVLETSPGNHQAWVAVEDADKDFARRLRKGTGSDPTASGATRVAGSLNFKEKYAPNFPRVTIRQINLGRINKAAELDRLDLVAAPEVAHPAELPPARPQRGERGSRRWPSYARSLEGAPLNHAETGPDISKADFVWCMTAISWGWSVDETKDRLMEESAKAQENGERYAELTARNAAFAVERRRGSKPQAPEHRR